jgi:hypothetical protein
MAQYDTHKHMITWTNAGDRSGDAPKEIIADDYSLSDGFYQFVVWTSDHSYDNVLTVRASDVAAIEMGEKVDSPVEKFITRRRPR